MKDTWRCFPLAMALLLLGCGGRTSLLNVRDGGSGDRALQPPGSGGQGGKRDAALSDAPSNRDATEVAAPDGMDTRDVPADSVLVADARPDVARELGGIVPETGKPDIGTGDRVDVVPEAGADVTGDGSRDLPADRYSDLPAEVGRDLLAESSRDLPAESNPDRPVDADHDLPSAGEPEALPEVPRDGSGVDVLGEAGESEAGHIDGSPDARSPGLYVLAGVLAGPGGLDGVGAEAGFYFPSGVAADGMGNLYVSDAANDTIRKIVVATGAVTTIAGVFGQEGTVDGIGLGASFFSPQGLAPDGAGNLYIADSVNSLIRKLVLATGEVTTIAGSGLATHKDGRGRNAGFGSPRALAYDGAGSLFVVDLDGTVRKIELATLDVTTLAGSAEVSGSDDGTGGAARFAQPEGLAWDGAGNLYVADTYNHTIRKIVAATGAVTTVAGSPGQEGGDDGTGTAARFSYPHGVACDGSGNLFVADFGSDRIRQVVLATGQVTTLAGGMMGAADGTGTAAELIGPEQLACDGAGNLFVADSSNHAIRKIVTATAEVTTFVGRLSSAGSTDGVGSAARFQGPRGLASDDAGNLLLADSFNRTLRWIDSASGTVTTVAGLAENAGSQDGTAAEARFGFPVALAYDKRGTVYVADQGNSTIRKVVLATAAVTTIAGTAGAAGYVDGIGVAARFNAPSALALDGAGNLFVADEASHTIRRIVLATGSVTTLAGVAGMSGTNDGASLSARFNGPKGLVCDGAGNLYVADSGNYAIRKIEIASATVTTFVGEAGTSGVDDGVGSAARFESTVALALDSAGNLLVADSTGNTVRRVSISTGLVSTIVGHGARWETVPGPLPAYVASPAGLAVLPSGTIAISDEHENAVLIAQF
jgi:hypothetical protein